MLVLEDRLDESPPLRRQVLEVAVRHVVDHRHHESVLAVDRVADVDLVDEAVFAVLEVSVELWEIFERSADEVEDEVVQ